MAPRYEVFDWTCRLVFYWGGLNDEEQRFVAVPDDRSVKMVLRGAMKSPVSILANRGRLYGIRQGSPSVLWPDEARKVGLLPSDGYVHDLVHYCEWSPDPISVQDGTAYRPTLSGLDR